MMTSSSSAPTTTSSTADAAATAAGRLNDELGVMPSAVDRVRRVLHYARENGLRVVQTTSFGIESALMLHLLSMANSSDAEDGPTTKTTSDTTAYGITSKDKVPIIFIDTGYLPKETYQFAKDMKERYNLNLCIYQSEMSPARMEATYGRLWEDESEPAHILYNTLRKVLPMQDALQELGADIILTGLRASQTDHRRDHLSFVNVEQQGPNKEQSQWKVCPILDWDDETVHDFFQVHDLPYHPLYYQNYRTVGDWHSSQPYDPNRHSNFRDTRFGGRTQECGLHTATTMISNLSLTDQAHLHRDRSSWSSTSSPSLASTTTNDSSTTEENESESFSLSSSHDNVGFVIYGRPSCKYCRAAKALLYQVVAKGSSMDPGIPITEIQVGKDITVPELIARFGGKDIKTVPQILYQGRYIGGYDDLCQWGTTRYDPVTFRDAVDAIVVE
jgi:phosphoadenosine phosphosulfate reductase